MKQKVLLLIIFIIALLLRISTLATVIPGDNKLGLDAAQYNELALSLLEGKGFCWGQYREQIVYSLPLKTFPGQPTSFREPLYPFFLASIYFVFGQDLNVVRIIQAILGAFLCLIIFLISREIFNERVGLIAAFLSAIYPTFVSYLYFGGPKFILSENLYIFLLALDILILLRFIKNSSLLNQILVGLFFGLTALTRAEILFFPFLFCLVYIFINKEILQLKIKRVFFILFCFMLTLTPWTIRNYFVHHKLVLISTKGGYALRYGNNPLARGSWTPSLDPSKFYGLSEYEMSKEMAKEALVYLKTHIWHIPKLFFRKTLALWHPYGIKYNFQYGIIMQFSLFGIWLSLRQKSKKASFILILLFLYFTAIAMVFLGDIRFRYSIEPYLIIFAALAFDFLFKKFKMKPVIPILVIAFVILTNYMLYFNSDKLLVNFRNIFIRLRLN